MHDGMTYLLHWNVYAKRFGVQWTYVATFSRTLDEYNWNPCLGKKQAYCYTFLGRNSIPTLFLMTRLIRTINLNRIEVIVSVDWGADASGVICTELYEDLCVYVYIFKKYAHKHVNLVLWLKKWGIIWHLLHKAFALRSGLAHLWLN